MIIENKMSRHKSFVCETCSQDFTRKSSANRHNHNIHFGRGKIVRFLEYVVRNQFFADRISQNKIRDHKLLVCATCSQDFTRKSSAERHNRNIHLGMGEIVRFIDYVIGRLGGKYVAADPSLFKKNNGNNIRKTGSSFASSIHMPSPSYGDTIARKEDNPVLDTQWPSVQAKDDRHDLSDLDYMVNLVSRVSKIENLLPSRKGNTPAIPGMWNNNPHGIDVNTLLAQQFDIDNFFGYRGETCPSCAGLAIHRLDFRGGGIRNRIWSTNHKCDPNASVLLEKESRSTRYVNARDSMPIYLTPIVNRWLKSGLNIFAIKLPQLFDIDKGLIEITHPIDPSRSVCVPFSKEEIVTKTTDNPRHWAARAVDGKSKPTPISGEELLNFLLTVQGSTFGLFKICLRELGGWRGEYYLIYLGTTALGEVQVHTDL